MAKDADGLHIQSEEEFAAQLAHAEEDLGTFDDEEQD
jgi:hypothetical protein